MMKRLVLIVGLVLLLGLAACDTLGPAPTQQQVIPTGDISVATPSDEEATAAASEVETATAPAEGPAPEEGAETTGADLTGVTWEWVSVIDPMGQTTASDPTRYTVVFNGDGTMAIVADCNSVTGNYITDGVNIDIELGATTLVACPPDSQDQLFLNSLSRAATYDVVDGELFITMIADGGTVIFRPAQAAAEGGAEGEAAEPPAATALTGVTWEWVSTTSPAGEIVAADPARYTIVFNEDGTAGIQADCNVGSATYTTGEGNALSIELGAFTLAFCMDSQDQQFRDGLVAASTYSLEDGALVLGLAGDGGTMSFRAGAAPVGEEAAEGEVAPAPAGDSLTGVTWQWISTTTPLEVISVADPTRYEITFNEDGTAGIKADCNMAGATYTTDETGALAITLGPSTLAMCPPDSQVSQFLAGLAASATYSFQDGNLFIDMMADGGTMQFAPVTTTEGAGPVKGGTSPVAGAGEFAGTIWQLNLISKIDGTITINDPSRYTITFNEDGTANFQADCNVGAASYTTGDGNMLTITPGPTTLAFCGPGSLDQVFLGGLTNAMAYRLEDGNLVIEMLYESGTMVFSPAS